MDKFSVYDTYYYVDPDNEYTYLDTSVLKNKFKLDDFDKLMEKEYQLVKIKALDLFLSPIIVHSMKEVCKIHHELFSELYT